MYIKHFLNIQWARYLRPTVIMFIILLIAQKSSGEGPKEPGNSQPIPTDKGTPPRTNGHGVPNLCVVPDLIVFAKVIHQEARYDEAPGGYGFFPDETGRMRLTIYTRSEIYVERVIRGMVTQGMLLLFDLEGGELNGEHIGVSDKPTLIKDLRYLLFLRNRDDLPQPKFLAHYQIPPTVELPPEDVMKQIWSATCDAHPEGIYFWGPKIKIVIPKEIAGAVRGVLKLSD